MRSSRPLFWRFPPRSISSALFIRCVFLVLGWLAPPDAALAEGVLNGSIEDDEPAAPSPPAGSESGPGAAASSIARFDAALQLVSAGQERQAAALLVRLATERPTDEIAPEALFEAGLLYEEHLGKPEAAQRCYRKIRERYRTSRLLRRAEQRLEHLDTALRTGATALVSFQQILRDTTSGSRERYARLGALLSQEPSFALADQVLFLLADTALRSGQPSLAMGHFEELYRRFPLSQWAAQGHRLHAETLLQSRKLAEARLHYQALEGFSGALWPLLSREGLLACQRAARRLYFAIAAWGFLGGFGLLLLVRGRRHLWPPPFEIFYYVPVAGFLTLAAWILQRGQGGPLFLPIGQFGLAGALLSWLAAAAAEESSPFPHFRKNLRAPRQLAPLLAGLLGRALAVAALCYLIVYHHGLIEILVETLKNGPETGN